MSLKPKVPKVFIQGFRDDAAILKRVKAIMKKTGCNYTDAMRKVTRDGLEANE